MLNGINLNVFYYLSPRSSKLEVLESYQEPEDGGTMFERPPYSVRFRAKRHGILHFESLSYILSILIVTD